MSDKQNRVNEQTPSKVEVAQAKVTILREVHANADRTRRLEAQHTTAETQISYSWTSKPLHPNAPSEYATHTCAGVGREENPLVNVNR